MPKYVTVDLDPPSSQSLLKVIARSEDPTHFVFRGESHLLLDAYIDGCDTQYQLALSQDGSWHMRTVVEV